MLINKRKLIFYSLILIAIIAIPIYLYYSSVQLYKINNYLPNNLSVDNVNIGGKTLEEAIIEIDKLEEKQLKKTLVISYEDGKGYFINGSFSYGQLGYYGEKDEIIKKLNSIMNKKVNVIKRYFNYKNIEKSKLNYKLSYSIHYDKYINALKIFDNSALKTPVDARYEVKDKMVRIIQEEDGYIYDKDGLYKDLLANKDLTTAKLNVKSVKPAVTAAILETQGIKELITGFTTKFDGGNIPRSTNIRLAAAAINGTILAPGATFSFNEVVGERTKERGYKEAGVYVSGRVDTGIGGGICQVSTTLYNVVLFADLPVLERTNHSLTVAYVPLSRDATVSWGAQDFRFTNNTPNYILIYSSTTKNTVTFEMYSTKSNKRVELISTALAKIQAPVQYVDDPEALFGQETIAEKGFDGYQSKLIKEVYIDNIKVSSELVSKDKYLPAVKIIKRGTKIPDTILKINE